MNTYLSFQSSSDQMALETVSHLFQNGNLKTSKFVCQLTNARNNYIHINLYNKFVAVNKTKSSFPKY